MNAAQREGALWPGLRVAESEIVRAAGILDRGGLVAFPTETVYGLAADAHNAVAVARVFAAKGRPADHPLIVHISDANDMRHYARDIPPIAWRLAEHFWPGPLTLIMRRAPGLSDSVTGGQDTVALRIPAHPVALALLRVFGRGLAAPSANPFGGVSPTTAAHVAFGLGRRVDAILDGGPCALGLESTILDLTGPIPRLLRPGAVAPRALAAVVGRMPAFLASGGPRAPGRLPSHYAPATPLRLVTDPAREWRHWPRPLAVIALHPPVRGPLRCRWLVMPRSACAYGRALYARLRAIDRWGCRVVLVERPPAAEAWDAVRDRLERAASVNDAPKAVAHQGFGAARGPRGRGLRSRKARSLKG